MSAAPQLCSAANAQFLEAENPSKIQQMISDLFRSTLARNDDHTLLHSFLVKRSKAGITKHENKDKLIGDLREREVDRTTKENQTLQELAWYKLDAVEKHARKMARKMLLLNIEGKGDARLLRERHSIAMHTAYVMSEKSATPEEVFALYEPPDPEGEFPLNFSVLTESTADQIVESYTCDYSRPVSENGLHKLLTGCIERSREKFENEFAKYEGDYDAVKFFTEEGLKDRKERIKFKVLVGHGGKANRKKKEETETESELAKVDEPKDCKVEDLISSMTIEERAFKMMQIHNSRTERLRTRYADLYAKKKQAELEGRDPDEVVVGDRKSEFINHLRKKKRERKTEEGKRPVRARARKGAANVEVTVRRLIFSTL